jgi:phosphate-selective porin
MLLALIGLVVMGLSFRAQASDADLKKELESLKKEVEDLRKERSTAKPVGTGVVDKMVDNKYGPDAVVKTKQGKLTIGGLLQVWYYNIENDNLGFYDDLDPASPTGDTNEGWDNDSYSIRRARVNFTMDIHENVQAFIQMDLANSFDRRDVRALSNVSLRRPTTSTLDTNGNDFRNPLVDAYIKVHGLIPHHDSMIGQFQPKVGMEGVQNDGTLDFCERSMIGQLASGRDVGSQLHGTWMDDRIQYWLGVFNTPGTWLEGDTTQENRADNNDLKSFLVSAQFRPVWKNETWGSLELGGSFQFNKTGEAGAADPNPADVGTDGLNMRETNNIRWYGYASYAPGGPVKGWWLKGEYAWIRGRLASAVEYDAQFPELLYTQSHPAVFDTNGWYVSTGYKLSDSIWADDLPSWLKPAEFTFRYQTYGNIQLPDLSYEVQFVGDHRHQVFKTSIYTAGVNYYIKGHNAKIQVNYNWVNEPDGDHGGGYILNSTSRDREVNNDNLVVNFQVMW